MSNSLCRICLDEDDVDKLIYPCKCSGTSKYVHKKCLDEWRTLSDNPLALRRCFECKFNYVFSNEDRSVYYYPNCEEFVNKPVKFIFSSFIFIFTILGLLTFYDLGVNEPLNYDSFNSVLISILIYIILIYLIILYQLCSLTRNKVVYIKSYYREKLLVMCSLITLLIAFFIICDVFYIYDGTELISDFIGIILIIISKEMVLITHFRSLGKLYKTNLVEILNYNQVVMTNTPENKVDPGIIV